jgi:hypothetical protein
MARKEEGWVLMCRYVSTATLVLKYTATHHSGVIWGQKKNNELSHSPETVYWSLFLQQQDQVNAV